MIRLHQLSGNILLVGIIKHAINPHTAWEITRHVMKVKITPTWVRPVVGLSHKVAFMVGMSLESSKERMDALVVWLKGLIHEKARKEGFGFGSVGPLRRPSSSKI
jgi:hypothetical protein